MRSVCDDNARALESVGALRFLALGTRRGTAGVPPERTRLNPWIGLASYIAARTLSQSRAEAFRFSLLPWFDRWVKRQLQPGDHVISSFGYANECFRWARLHGAKTFLDGGNSHPENYHAVVAEEYRRWGCKLAPLPGIWHRRSLETMPLVDYVLSPSSYVTKSFLAHGFRPEQILQNIYPLDLKCFTPRTQSREKDRPLTIISTGAPSLRKGTPYLLDAFRIIRKTYPDARLCLNDALHDSMRPIMDRWNDLPIDWSPSLPHAQLAERLRNADIFVLPSIEEGLARTALEALACGLPVVVTSHTGANDFVEPGQNGYVIPIRDAEAVADACLRVAPRILNHELAPVDRLKHEQLSFEYFARKFLSQLQSLGLLAS